MLEWPESLELYPKCLKLMNVERKSLAIPWSVLICGNGANVHTLSNAAGRGAQMTENSSGKNETLNPGGWWRAVQLAATLIVNDGCGFDDEELLTKEMELKGFSVEDIAKAISWVEKVAVSGQMMDSLGMLCPQPEGSRVDSPLERVFMSDAVWKDLESSRRKGLVSGDTTEMIIEGIRAVDTRDWEDEEVRTFITDVLTANGQEEDGKRIERNRRRRLNDFYS